MAPASELEASDATVAHGDMPSRTFASGRYAVVRVLPEGGQKIVFLVRDTVLDRDCALSLIKAGQLQSEDLQRLRREAQAMARLGTHAHLVTIFDIGDEDGRPYIVSEFVAGGELRHEIRAAAGPLPLDRALAVTRDVARALAFAHGRGIIHRDIKPANIWLTEDRAAKLGDFGLAFGADRSRLTQDGTFVGTAAYIAPEQALGAGADARSDLYALGCVLYEMVTGRVPFAGDDMVSVISQHIETAPVAPSWHNPQVPHALDTLIAQLLAKSPEDRPQSADALLVALDALTSAPPQIAAPLAANPLDRLAAGVFVGREREVDELRRGLDDALSGRGRLLLLVGEPGIGKTRTASELCTYARLRGAQVLTGRCYEGEGAPAYWPWVQAIRAYVAECDSAELQTEMGAGAADIAQMVSEVHAKLPGLTAPPQIEPEQARFRLFDSITTFLKNASRRQPLVLLLDDLHWADKASLLMLQFLARDLSGARLLVLGTYRDVELGRQHPLAQTLAELAREQVGTRVLLRGLGEPEVARYIEMTAGSTPSDALVAAVFRETEGNPFFLSEVVRLLVADGRLHDTGDTKSWTVAIPQSVREVVGRRLDRLSEQCDRVLTSAAVIGREFGLDALERVTQIDGDQLLELIEEAEAARVIEEVQGQHAVIGRYSFSHALIRETLYGELSTTRRVRLHRQIGEALEQLYAANVEPHLAGLAYHFGEAAPGGDVEKAIDYARRAGDRSLSLVAWEEAAGHYERALQALELLPVRDERRQAELLLALGDALSGAGERVGYKEAFARAADAARRSGDANAFASAALGFAPPWADVFDPQMTGLLEEALDLLAPGDSALRAMVTARLAQALQFGDQRERMTALEQEALAMARRVGDKPALAYTIGRVMFTADGYSRHGQLTDLIDEAIRLAEETGNKWAATNAYIFRVIDSLTRGERDVADAAIEVNERLTGELRTLGLVSQLRAMQARLDGRLDAVEALAQQGLVDLQRSNPQSALPFFGAQMLDLRRAQGRVGELESAVKGLADQFPLVPAYRAALALVHCAAGRRAEAAVEFAALVADDLAALPKDGNRPVSLTVLADVCSFLGDKAAAALLYDQLLPLADQCIVVGPTSCLGSASAPLGALATTLGRFDDAERHFADAIEMNLRLRAPTWVAEAQLGYAQMLLVRAAPGDRERALALLEEAIAAADAFGMKALLDKATALRAAALDADGAGAT